MIVLHEGMNIDYRGQHYRCEAIAPYTRKDGKPSALAIIASECAKCGEPFTMTLPAAVEKFMPNRRCKLHKRPGIKVRQR